MNNSAPILAIRDLSYRAFSGQTVLRDVSFEIERGSVLAIAGPNGAGKSTLLNLITGLTSATGGDIFIDGTNLRNLDAAERARLMAVVSQKSVPDSRLSLRDYVALGQMPIWADYSSKEHAAELNRILSIAGLETLADKSIDKVSGGERQRAHIARALAQKPHLLFLDEPTNHLDPEAKGRVLSLVTALGITVVMVIHDLVMIPEFATHIALMKDTKLTAFGSVSEVQTPAAIQEIFGVDYRLFPEQGRLIPALDIRKSHISNEGLLK